MYCRHYKAWQCVRAREPLARAIHLPKLPELLSLSLVALVWPVVVGGSVSRGDSRHDLISSRRKWVAVKGTGPAGWITLTETDRQADLLVWVDYGPRITYDAPTLVTIARIRQGLIDAPDRLTRAQFTSHARKACTFRIDPAFLASGQSVGVVPSSFDGF